MCETDDGRGVASTMAGGADMELDRLRRFRRDLHQIPELDFDLPKTIAYVTRELESVSERANRNSTGRSIQARATVFSPSRSSVCCHFDLGTTHATAIRSDMDALPVSERTGVAYASTHPGRMHACGHDGHMSMVLGLAWWLADHLDRLPRSLLLVFQPAEETTGGAKAVCESGVFERLGVDRIYGFHLWPELPRAALASRAGALLASSREVSVSFSGRASHIARAEDGADALEACCDFLGRAYASMDECRLEEACLLKFGRMEAGEVRNQIAASARLEGSLRTFSTTMGRRVSAELPRIARDAAEPRGCEALVSLSEGYPPVVNDENLYVRSREWLAMDDIELKTLPEPLLIAEDFAWYQQWLPGMFLLLGTGTGIPLHSDRFDFDESILVAGLDVYKRLVMMP
ncbi:amidohydrolase [Olsenella sp. oral taxon 807]|uniref:amidohydrolase n=1 Tax=Olsenella sp. oral taxon 807 TaxID=712411 RepID=UPI000AD56DE4|nr:amidohydrolase [Olsenella sp. oral taxon 807]